MGFCFLCTGAGCWLVFRGVWVGAYAPALASGGLLAAFPVLREFLALALTGVWAGAYAPADT